MLDTGRLHGKVALLTGASSGISEAVLQELGDAKSSAL